MAEQRLVKPTEFKVEFWTAASGRDRKHRSRYYATTEGMLRAGARWEAKGRDHWCRYWNGSKTWLSATRSTGTTTERASRRRIPSQTFSIFGVCEATAAKIMLKDGRIKYKIPVEQIPDSVLYNDFGNKALFAVIVPGDQIHAFNELIKDLRA